MAPGMVVLALTPSPGVSGRGVSIRMVRSASGPAASRGVKVLLPLALVGLLEAERGDSVHPPKTLDLARGHVQSVGALIETGESHTVNLGTGTGSSVPSICISPS